MYDALAVANAFIDLAKESGEEITHLKLQKLIYIAYGWYFVNFDIPLIKERVEAWKYGPVIRSVYDEFKTCGRNPITDYGTVVNVLETFGSDKIILDTPKIEDPEALEFIGEIWNVFGSYNGYELANSTHKEGTPWYQAKEKNLDIVPDDFIKNYYKKMADED